MGIDFLPPPVVESAWDETRVLTQDEIKTVEHHFTSRGCVLPDPAVSAFVGAIRNGKVVGFVVLQVKLHAEPIVVEEGHSDVFLPLIAKAEETILQRVGPQWVYLFAPAGRTAQLAQSMGLQVEPWVVLSKLVTPRIPERPTAALDIPLDYPADAPAITPEELAEYPGEGAIQ